MTFTDATSFSVPYVTGFHQPVSAWLQLSPREMLPSYRCQNGKADGATTTESSVFVAPEAPCPKVSQGHANPTLAFRHRVRGSAPIGRQV